MELTDHEIKQAQQEAEQYRHDFDSYDQAYHHFYMAIFNSKNDHLTNY